MTINKDRKMVREVVGIFFDGSHLKAALAELDSAGFEHEQISLLGSEFAIEKSLGDLYARTNEYHDISRTPATAFVLKNSVGDAFRSLGGGLFFAGSTAAAGGLVVSSAIFGGALLAAVTGAVAVGIVGTLTAYMIIHRNEAEFLEEQVEEGHLLLFVRASNSEAETQAVKILSAHSGFDVKIYLVPLNPPSQIIHR